MKSIENIKEQVKLLDEYVNITVKIYAMINSQAVERISDLMNDRQDILDKFKKQKLMNCEDCYLSEEKILLEKIYAKTRIINFHEKKISELLKDMQCDIGIKLDKNTKYKKGFKAYETNFLHSR